MDTPENKRKGPFFDTFPPPRCWISSANGELYERLGSVEMMIGYARVSTEEQNPALQIDALTHAGCDRIFQDSISGALQSRPALDQAIAVLRPGDTLVAWKLDRLGRNLSHLLLLISALEKKGVAFRSLSEAIDTNTAGGRLLLQIMGALAEFERTLISERTKAGIAAARARGKIIGRPRKCQTSFNVG